MGEKLRRMCVACRKKKEKYGFIKVVRVKGDDAEIDFKFKMNGRSAYVCRDSLCIKKAKKIRAFEHALHCNLNNEFWQKLEEI